MSNTTFRGELYVGDRGDDASYVSTCALVSKYVQGMTVANTVNRLVVENIPAYSTIISMKFKLFTLSAGGSITLGKTPGGTDYASAVAVGTNGGLNVELLAATPTAVGNFLDTGPTKTNIYCTLAEGAATIEGDLEVIIAPGINAPNRPRLT